MTTLRRRLAALFLLALPLAAAANGGSSGVSRKTSNAMAGGDGGALSKTELVAEDDVECTSEDLSINLGDEVRVQVDYVFVNRGATKTLAYAFPFALAERAFFVNGKQGETQRFGEPSSYSIEVNGKPEAAGKRSGGDVPTGIPVPAIVEGTVGAWDPEDEEAAPAAAEQKPVERITEKLGYRWSYRVSQVEFPAGQPLKLRVRYQMPYLVYEQSGELGQARSPGEFSYLLSTGGGWRGRTIGKLRVSVVSSEGSPAQIRVQGLPFVRTRLGWGYEATDFKPGIEKNIVVRRSEFANIPLMSTEDELQPLVSATQKSETGGRLCVGGGAIFRCPATRTGPASWTSPPVGGRKPVVIALFTKDPREADDSEQDGGGWPSSRPAETGRYRLRLAFATEKDVAQPSRVRVRLGFRAGREDLFRATFAVADPADLAWEHGWRSIWFDAKERPDSITLTLEDVVPGAKGSRSVEIKGIALEADVSNYTAYVPHAR
jgi:hypothetical protein